MNRTDGSASSARSTAGTVLIALGGLVLVASAAAKFARVPAVTAQLGAFGFEGSKLRLIAILEVLSAGLFLVWRTRSAGLLLVSAFLGGAIATHLQHGESVLRPASVLTLLWLGAWLRHPEMLWSVGLRAGVDRPQETTTVDNGWRLVPWLSRIVLAAATAIFSLIAVKYLADPVGTAAAFKISLGSAAAVTNMRVGFGAFPLGFALVTLGSLLTARHVTGLWFVATIVGAVTAGRILGIALDGPAHESLTVLRPEVVLFTLSSVGLVLEGRRRSQRPAGRVSTHSARRVVAAASGIDADVVQRATHAR